MIRLNPDLVLSRATRAIQEFDNGGNPEDWKDWMGWDVEIVACPEAVHDLSAFMAGDRPWFTSPPSKALNDALAHASNTSDRMFDTFTPSLSVLRLAFGDDQALCEALESGVFPGGALSSTLWLLVGDRYGLQRPGCGAMDPGERLEQVTALWCAAFQRCREVAEMWRATRRLPVALRGPARVAAGLHR